MFSASIKFHCLSGWPWGWVSQDKPDEYLPIFEEGAKDALDQILLERGGEDEQDKEVRWGGGAEGGRGGGRVVGGWRTVLHSERAAWGSRLMALIDVHVFMRFHP